MEISNDTRVSELRRAMKRVAPMAHLVSFLDTINSIEELEELAPYFNDQNRWLVNYYMRVLNQWSSPELPDGFRQRFPLVSMLLHTPQKVRVFLRGAEFRDVDPNVMGGVFEEILRRHEVDGERKLVFKLYPGDERISALRIVYLTELQAWSLTRLMIPGASIFIDYRVGLIIDWRTTEERRVAGEKC